MMQTAEIMLKLLMNTYKKSNGINSKRVQNLLQETSLVPTMVYTSLLLDIVVANV